MAKTETKKTNKKTLGAVFCALSLGVAGVTGLMLNDSNKKYDALKKDNAVQIEQFKTQNGALKTQITQLQTQLNDFENLSVEMENATLSYEFKRYNVNYWVDKEQGFTAQISFCESGELDAASINRFIENTNEIMSFYMYDTYNLYVGNNANVVDVALDGAFDGTRSQCNVNFINTDGNPITFENDKVYRCVNISESIVYYSTEEANAIGYGEIDYLLKTADLTVTFEEVE